VRTAVATTAAAVSLLSPLLAACTRSPAAPPVAVDAVPTARAAECARFAARLPSSLGDGLKRRRTEPADPHVAAYGEGVVIRCAAPASKRYQPGDPLFTVNGFAWYADERPDVVVWSLPKAFVNVEVTMPAGVTGDRLARLTDAVRAAQPGG
jgi:hypothetical protein